MIVRLVFVVLLVASCGDAFRSGGSPERMVAAIMLLGLTLSPLVAHHDARLWHGPEIGILIVDGSALVAFALLTAKFARYWLIWTTAFQLLTVMAHVGPIFRSTNLALAFAIDEQIWSWIILLQLIVVTRMSSLRLRATTGRSCANS